MGGNFLAKIEGAYDNWVEEQRSEILEKYGINKPEIAEQPLNNLQATLGKILWEGRLKTALGFAVAVVSAIAFRITANEPGQFTPITNPQIILPVIAGVSSIISTVWMAISHTKYNATANWLADRIEELDPSARVTGPLSRKLASALVNLLVGNKEN